ncbi:MAG: HepT-like ribonuclease domain-containing protein [Pyrinomonadaceae bacterium]
MEKENVIRLKHILESIGKIEDYLLNFDEEKFGKDNLRQDAVVRQLEIIGEASKKLTIKLKESHPQIEWRKMAGTRDRLAHGYFSVDIEIVWRITQEFLPSLKTEIKKILENLS